jgi:hypothetical protein
VQPTSANTDADRARELIETPPIPRRLRLDELLRALGATEPETRQPPVIVGPLEPPREADRQLLSVGELVDKAAEGGFGFVIGILTLIAIPFFGLSTPFGLAIALIGAQMMIGRSVPWLPRRARRRQLKMSMLDRVVGMLARRTRWLARSTRRRLEFLITPRLIGLAIVILSLGLALPLPIPGSNLVFLIPLFVYSVGLLERDGAWILIGHLLLLVDLALLFVFSATVIMVLEKIWAWFT